MIYWFIYIFNCNEKVKCTGNKLHAKIIPSFLFVESINGNLFSYSLSS